METFHDWWYNVTLVIKLQFLYNSRRKERSSKKKFAFRFVLWVSQKRLQYFLLFLLFSMQCWDFWFHVLLSHQWVVIICWWSVGVGIRWWSLGVGGGGNSVERKLGQRVSLPNLWWTAEVQNHSKYHRPWSTAYRYSWNDAGMKN